MNFQNINVLFFLLNTHLESFQGPQVSLEIQGDSEAKGNISRRNSTTFFSQIDYMKLRSTRYFKEFIYTLYNL